MARRRTRYRCEPVLGGLQHCGHDRQDFRLQHQHRCRRADRFVRRSERHFRTDCHRGNARSLDLRRLTAKLVAAWHGRLPGWEALHKLRLFLRTQHVYGSMGWKRAYMKYRGRRLVYGGQGCILCAPRWTTAQ